MSAEGLAATTLAEAFAMSVNELESGEPSVDESALPADDSEVPEQADPDQPVGEQPDDATDDIAGLLDDLVDEEGDAPQAALSPDSEEYWEQTVPVETVDGPQNPTLKELAAGYMKDADYRQKTQEIAAERKTNADAIEFHKAFMAEPVEFARFLAVNAGIIEDGAVPVRQIEVAQIRTPEQVETEISRRLEERIQSDPRMQQAQVAAAQAAVDRSFAVLEEKYKTTLTPEHRQRIASEALKRNTTDLELVFEALLARAGRQRSERGNLRRTAPTRPGANKGAPGDEKPRVPQTVKEALEMATAELAGI